MEKSKELDTNQLSASHQRIGTGGYGDAAIRGAIGGLVAGTITCAITSAVFWYFGAPLMALRDIPIGSMIDVYKWTALVSFGVGGSIGGSIFAAISLGERSMRQRGEFRQHVAEAKKQFGSLENWSGRITDPKLLAAVESVSEELDREANARAVASMMRQRALYTTYKPFAIQRSLMELDRA